MKSDTLKHDSHSITRKIGYTIAGLALALTAGPLFVIGVYTIITSLAGH